MEVQHSAQTNIVLLHEKFKGVRWIDNERKRSQVGEEIIQNKGLV